MKSNLKVLRATKPLFLVNKEPLRDPGGGVYERMTYVAICFFQSEHGKDVPINADKLSEIVGCSPRAVSRALKRLAERGHIELENAGGAL